jgi:hypothetical protein
MDPFAVLEDLTEILDLGDTPEEQANLGTQIAEDTCEEHNTFCCRICMPECYEVA